MSTNDQTTESKLKEILEGFDDAMLMTKADGQKTLLRARPMRVADVSDDSTLWFFTGVDSGKVRDALADEDGYVILQKSMKQVVLRGTLTITKNPEKIAQLWSKPLEVWFPKGPTDPNVCLMRFTPSEAEYWDNSGLNGVKYAWESAKAFMAGTTPQGIDRSQHAKIDLGRS
jgi:general stress protein 26